MIEDAIEGADSPLVLLFLQEVLAHAAVLDDGLAQASQGPADAGRLDPPLQAALAIRSAARVVGAEAAAAIAHALAEGLESARAGKVPLAPEVAAVFLEAVEVLRRGAEAGGEPPELFRPEDGSVGPLLDKLQIAARTPAAPAPGPTAVPAKGGPPGDASLLELFRHEVLDLVATLNTGLVNLEEGPTEAQRIEPLMRAAHSIKGAARVVGVDAGVQVAHAMEDALVAAQAGRVTLGAGEIDVLFRGVDVLTQIARLPEHEFPAWRTEANPDVAALIGRLQAVANGTRPPAAPSGEGAEASPPASGGNGAAAPASAAPAAPAPPGGQEGVVRVTAESLTRLMSLAGESLVETRWLQPFARALLLLKRQQDQLASVLDELDQRLVGLKNGEPSRLVAADARRRVADCRRLLADRIEHFEAHARQSDDLNSRLYNEVVASRMRPFADGVQGFPRLARDLARQLGKKVRLDVAGHDTGVDREVLERLDAPLTHLLRNAIDHGIEPPAERAAAGKPEAGTVRLEARHVAGTLSILVRDDGRGIDLGRLRRKVVERGHAAAEMAASLSEGELLDFLFVAGFSTADRVTEVSGRGVGLDVVHNMVHSLGGSVRLTTEAGQGTTFALQLPITLSVIRAVLVDIAGEAYALPHNRIDRVLRVPLAEVRSLEGRQYCAVDGRNVGLVPAEQILELAPAPRAGDELPLVLLSAGPHTYGIVVDGFRGEQDLVVRPLDPRLGKVPNLAAAALLDDGSPVLIFDIEDLVRSIDNLVHGGRPRRARAGEAAGAAQARKRILVVDDSITVREVERQMLANRGFDVEVAVDGMDGWNAVRAGDYDLVVSDVDMPRMNGLDLVRAIKQDPRLRGVSVVIVSYKGREEDRRRGLEAGADYYLTKNSFHDDALLGAVQELIGGPEA